MIEYEIIKHDKTKDMRIFVNSIRMRSLHTHHDIELLLVNEGQGTIVIKGRNYHVSKGDTLLINAYDNHEIYSLDGLKVIIVQFSNHFLNDYFQVLRNSVFNDLLPRVCIPTDEYRSLVANILNLSRSYFLAEDYFELECVQIMTQILLQLFRNLEIMNLTESESNIRKKNNRRIDRISSYIDAHYQEPIRLVDLASLESVSVTHLSHFISENFGMSFQKYLNDKRLSYALRMMPNRSLTLSQIAVDSGFSELKYMKKAFLDTFGLTPDQYRKQGLIDLPVNRREDSLEYIYPLKDSLELIEGIDIDKLLDQ